MHRSPRQSLQGELPAQTTHDQRDLLHVHLVTKDAHQELPVLERQFAGTEQDRFDRMDGNSAWRSVTLSADVRISTSSSPLDLLHIPLEIRDFLILAVGGDHRNELRRIVLAGMVVKMTEASGDGSRLVPAKDCVAISTTLPTV